MTDMTPKKRQMMQDMIEFAAKDQQKQIDNLKTLYKERTQAAFGANEKEGTDELA